MGALPKKKHTRSRTKIRRGDKGLTLKVLHARYSKVKGIRKKIEELGSKASK